MRGPGFSRTDLSFFKNFALRGAHQVQLRVEAFNMFNQERFGQPNGTIGAPTFGQITAADDGRIVQLGLKSRFETVKAEGDAGRGPPYRGRTT